jgi:thymidylate synthase
MKTFIYESLELAYPEIIKALINEGKDVSPRGMLTKELAPACITITNPRKRIIPSAIRKMNFGFMYAELIWMLQASNDVNFIGHYNSNWKTFSDDGATLNGAYGKRIFNWDAGIRINSSTNKKENGDIEEKSSSVQVNINQFQKAYEQLKNDPDTRQATIVLFDPFKDYRETKDKPCTNLLRFMIREGKLNMTVFMRSNDIILGTPYDIFNFTMMQEMMAGMLGIEVGVYNHIVDSLHIYESNFAWGLDLMNENYPLLYQDECMDARISMNNITGDFDLVFSIEKETRENKEADEIEIASKLGAITNEYWRSMAATIAVYNFRKNRRPETTWNPLRAFITNELKDIINERWKPLKSN